MSSIASAAIIPSLISSLFHTVVFWLRVLFISPEGIINSFLSLVYTQAVYKRVYKPPTKIASRGAGNWFKADFSPQDT
jgi:hypothetical protein